METEDQPVTLIKEQAEKAKAIEEVSKLHNLQKYNWKQRQVLYPTITIIESTYLSKEKPLSAKVCDLQAAEAMQQDVAAQHVEDLTVDTPELHIKISSGLLTSRVSHVRIIFMLSAIIFQSIFSILKRKSIPYPSCLKNVVGLHQLLLLLFLSS